MKGFPEICHFIPRFCMQVKELRHILTMSQVLPGPARAPTTPTWKDHCSKGYTLGCSSKVEASSSREVTLSPRLTLVRPHRECCVHFWILTVQKALTYQARALTVLKRSWENWSVHPQEEKAKSPYSCLQVPDGYGWKGTLALIRHAQWKATGASWKMGNSQFSRKQGKIYHEGGQTLGQESRKHMGLQSLKILRTLLPRTLKNLLLLALPWAGPPEVPFHQSNCRIVWTKPKQSSGTGLCFGLQSNLYCHTWSL